MKDELHIGHEIKEYAKSHGIKLHWLSQQLHCHRNTLYNVFERRWIDTDLLMRLSLVLEHDFFADISEEYVRKQKLKGRKME